MNKPTYRALVSSDWNECLAPCGPFDFVAFNYPQLAADLTTVFRQYTGNHITLGQAVGKIDALLPAPLTPEQIDAYLDHAFEVYRGVPELIEWCARNAVLFMVNTTGMIGYFQRVFAKGLLPAIPVLSACPKIRFSACASDPQQVHDLLEIPDKATNTAATLRNYGIAPSKLVVMGDSGGDGPHFEWGAKQGAFLVGSMTKPSLSAYCSERRISIDVLFGHTYRPQEPKDFTKEMAADFMNLVPVIERVVAE